MRVTGHRPQDETASSDHGRLASCHRDLEQVIARAADADSNPVGE